MILCLTQHISNTSATHQQHISNTRDLDDARSDTEPRKHGVDTVNVEQRAVVEHVYVHNLSVPHNTLATHSQHISNTLATH